MQSKAFLLLAAATAVPLCRALGLSGITKPDSNRPYCATACFGSLSSYRLTCSIVEESHGDGGSDDHSGHSMAVVTTTPKCRAGDGPWLRSLAYCIDSKCGEVGESLSLAQLEGFWVQKSTTDPELPAMWSYTQALHNVSGTPTMVLTHGGTINETVVPPFFWIVLWGTYSIMGENALYMNIFGLVILVSGFALPLLLTWIGYLPFIGRLYEKLNPYVVYPSLIGRFHARPLPYLLGNPPTVGQAIYVFYLFAINLIFSAVLYRVTPGPHLWFQNNWQQINGYIMYRTGVLSYAMAPLLILFAGRNNILLWLTNWPHSTFILLHRWVARLFVLQAVVHSILAVVVYKDMGIYAVQSTLVYWYWGVVATVLGCVMLVVSTLDFRRLSYEVFLVLHVVMAVLVIVGCWYHVWYRFDISSGFTTWLYAACAVWFFDRLARLFRMARVGVRRARLTDVGEGYVRVDVEGVRWGGTPGRHAYVYFPTLHPLRPWENHPFSVIPTSMIDPPAHTINKTTAAAATAAAATTATPEHSSDHNSNDVEKHQPAPVTVVSPAQQQQHDGGGPGTRTTAGVTFFIRKSTGMTKSLAAGSGGAAEVPVLLDGDYPNNPTSSLLRTDRLLLVAGGIGITGVLPWLRAHPNARLAWTVRVGGECLVRALDPALLATAADRDVLVGGRTDVRALLDAEVARGWARIGVVACGPAGLCDDVRALVAEAGRREEKTVFELEVDAYSW